MNVLLVGYGSINQRLHALLLPFGCRVVTFSRPGDGAELWTLEELDRVLPDADVVAAALPGTPETRHLFGRDRLARMKCTAIFANAGRGSLVEEPALVDALRTGQLGGAVIDVTEAEPLPASHELWACLHTIITQHTAGGSIDEVDRKLAFFHENLCR